MQQSHTRTRPDADPPAPTPLRLLVGLGSSCAAGIGMGKLIRGPLKRQVHKFDSALFAATRKIESPFMDRAMAVFSSLGEPSLLYSLSGTLALLWLVNGKGRESAALEFAVLGSATIDKVTKATIHRPRPYLKLPLARSRPSGSSFPSNHAMMSLTTYGALASMSGRKRLNAVPRDTEYLPSDWLVPPAVGGPEGTPPILQVPSGRHVSRTPRSGTPDRRNRKRARKRMIRIGLALTLSAFVSWSRVYRGVHNPSDVLAGWILGGFWLSVCYSWRGAGG